MPVPPGGPANLNGVLYQAVRYLQQVGEVSVRQLSDPDGSESVFVLEPVGGGGDIVEMAGGICVVEQLKADSNAGSWSLASVVSKVLPDLYRAVDINRKSTYRFITEGHRGRWKDAADFFSSLGGRV